MLPKMNPSFIHLSELVAVEDSFGYFEQHKACPMDFNALLVSHDKLINQILLRDYSIKQQKNLVKHGDVKQEGAR